MKQWEFQRVIFLSLLIPAFMMLGSCASTQSSEVAANTTESIGAPIHAVRYPAFTRSDKSKSIGDLWIGKTTLKEALELFPETPPGDPRHTGAPRSGRPPAYITYDGENLKAHPRTIFNPWSTMYQLWFDEQKILKVVVDASSPEDGQSPNALEEKYAGIHRVEGLQDSDSSTQMQARLNPCAVVTFWISKSTNLVVMKAVAYHCD